METYKELEKVEDLIMDALEAAKEFSKAHPSREASRTVTKLEEAEMWCERIKTE